MEALELEITPASIEVELQNHPAWLGYISGLKADKMLRGQKPFTYTIRPGENAGDYYVTHVLEDGTIRHTPFYVTITENGWLFENACVWGPYLNVKLERVLSSIMHCPNEQTTPFIPTK